MQMKQFVTVDKSPVLKAHQRSLQITGEEFAPPLDNNNNNLLLLGLTSNRAINTVQHPPRRAGNNSHHAGQKG